MPKSLFPRLGAALAVFLCAALSPAAAKTAGAPADAPSDVPGQVALTVEGPRTVHLVSLFWPPYVGKELPFGGIDTQLIRQALAQEGLDLKVDFVPWTRALAMFESGMIDGIYPEYPERGDKHTHCAMSQAYRTANLSIAEPVDKPITWDQVRDLSRYRIGIVRGYLNTPEFDALVANGLVRVEVEPTDVINLRKVAAQRIDGALIDPEVYRYMTENDVSLQPLLGLIQLNPKPLAERTLHICFLDTARGRSLRQVFHAGLKDLGLALPERGDLPVSRDATVE